MGSTDWNELISGVRVKPHFEMFRTALDAAVPRADHMLE